MYVFKIKIEKSKFSKSLTQNSFVESHSADYGGGCGDIGQSNNNVTGIWQAQWQVKTNKEMQESSYIKRLLMS